MNVPDPIIDFRVRPPLPSFLSQFNFAVVRGEMSVDWPFFDGADRSASVVDSSMDAFMDELAEAGLTHAVIMGRSAPGGGQCSDDAELVACRDAHTSKFSLFAGLGPPHVLQAREAVEALAAQGFVGVAIEGALWGLHADHPSLMPLYEAAAEAGLMISLTAAQGVSPDDLAYAHPDPIRRVAKHVPDTPIIVAHACWPYTNLACALAYECKNVYLLPDVYITVRAPGWRDYVHAANETIGNQLLFASTYPIQPLVDSVERYASAGFTPDALRAAFYDNAARLLGWPAQGAAID